MNIGAAWIREGKESGKKYVSAVIELPIVGKIQFAMFKNEDKTEDKHPDYNLVWSPAKDTSKKSESSDPFMDDTFPV